MRKLWNGASIATFAIGLLILAPPGWGKEPYRQVLISADRNMNVDPFLFGRDMIVSRYATPECPTAWSVRKFRYFGGKQEQVYMVWIDNGKLQIGLIPTRRNGHPIGAHGRQARAGVGFTGQGSGASQPHQSEQPRRAGLARGI